MSVKLRLFLAALDLFLYVAGISMLVHLLGWKVALAVFVVAWAVILDVQLRIKREMSR